MRDFGSTNVAPYASAPAVGPAGSTYWNTTTKVLYGSDGTAWIAVGPGTGGVPSGAAGGSLSGTYPNPTIADGAVTLTKFAVKATIRDAQFISVPSSWSVSAFGAWQRMMTPPAVNVAQANGSFVLHSIEIAWRYLGANGSLNAIYIRVLRHDGSTLCQMKLDVAIAASVPLPTFLFVEWAPPAAVTGYGFDVYVANNAGNVVTAGDSSGTWWQIVLA